MQAQTYSLKNVYINICLACSAATVHQGCCDHLICRSGYLAFPPSPICECSKLSCEPPTMTTFLSPRYSSLLDQFVAVSYGDHLFASYLCVPLQQQHSSHFRTMLWNDHPTIFRIFSLPLTQLPSSLSSYLYPEEQDPVLLGLYMNALGTGVVRWASSTVLIVVTLAISSTDQNGAPCCSSWPCITSTPSFSPVTVKVFILSGRHCCWQHSGSGTRWGCACVFACVTSHSFFMQALRHQLLLYSGHTPTGLQLAPGLSDRQRTIISLYCPEESA